MSIRRYLLLAIAGLMACCAGCIVSPEDQLIGRWYNSEMTIRFRPDGGVVLNTPAGKAIGRYYFDSATQSVSQDGGQENLVLDIVRNGQRMRLGFDANILSADRLQLMNLGGRARRELVILKRAGDSDTQLAM